MFYKVIQCQTLMDSTDRNNTLNGKKKKMFGSFLNTEFIINKMMSLGWLGHSPRAREMGLICSFGSFSRRL